MLIAIGALTAWESLWWARRRLRRSQAFEQAAARAAELDRPLVVVGSPDGGVTAGYGCGDITVDIAPTSTCPTYIQADITQRIPMADDSCVVYVSCVLEYVEDLEAAMREIDRVSGGERLIVHVEPWTVAAYAYPGAKRTIPSGLMDSQRFMPNADATLRSQGGFAPLRLQIAATPEDRALGLMWRFALPARVGMLFVWPEVGRYGFWMRSTFIPLDVIFLDEELRVIEIFANAEPCSEEVFEVDGAKYMLEVAAGLSEQIGLRRGDRLVVAP